MCDKRLLLSVWHGTLQTHSSPPDFRPSATLESDLSVMITACMWLFMQSDLDRVLAYGSPTKVGAYIETGEGGCEFQGKQFAGSRNPASFS